jgi:AraC-like DNA-binding protein
MSGLKSDSATAGAETSPREDSQQSTSIGSYSIAIARALEASGVDSARIFRAVGIPVELSTDPMVRLPTATITRLYRACVEVTNNPYFGLTVSKYIQLPHMHALGYALAASSTLMDFCRRLERYFRLVSHVAKARLTESEGKVFLHFEFLVEPCGETEDAFFGFLVRTMRQLSKPGFNPLRLEMHRPMPHEGAEPYEALIRAPVIFSQPGSLLVFDKAELTQNLVGSCPELAQASDSIVISYLARLDKSDVITRVTEKIIEFLPNGDCTRDKVASALCISPTTLQLKLSQRGTHFQQLLDDTRKELASSYLRQASRSVTEITFLLGFSDTSNFTRAFKRWTGLSPTDFRQQV